jgi:hypothetical protein
MDVDKEEVERILNNGKAVGKPDAKQTVSGSRN